MLIFIPYGIIIIAFEHLASHKEHLKCEFQFAYMFLLKVLSKNGQLVGCVGRYK